MRWCSRFSATKAREYINYGQHRSRCQNNSGDSREVQREIDSSVTHVHCCLYSVNLIYVDLVGLSWCIPRCLSGERI